ncbi:hypothetical protein HPP92_014784 [Vanilla planifolia]|uniref:Uncharacterized protein n=1 Tax=Vanilla planifolia TaxID=51239 RepID=A0A835QV63_VANPL|nr:hypothetical protein HPP92_015291 [Vanilla planifolia]KAG0475098.1 hypothetical protein HPP92_014784 [Vanilla planifolia]
MAVAFARVSCWLWGTKDHESANSALVSPSDFSMGFRELDLVRFPSAQGSRTVPSSRRMRRKWQSREERRVRVDREYDAVIVPSDGGCMSGSESDGSDWSIGWVEPHAPDFHSDEEGSFAVLVPCYGRGRREEMQNLENHSLGAVPVHKRGFSFVFNAASSAEGKDYIESWLSSLQEL